MQDPNDVLANLDLDFDLDFDMDDLGEDPAPAVVEPQISAAAVNLEALRNQLNNSENLPIHKFGAPGDSSEFLSHMLPAIKEDYQRTGCGIYRSILAWRFAAHVNDTHIRLFSQSVRSAAQRMRAMAPGVAMFYVTLIKAEIVDTNHVIVTFARMSSPVYKEYERQRASARINAMNGGRRSRILGAL